MKIYGTITELVSLVWRKNSQAITFRPNQATTYTASRDVQLPPGDSAHELVGTAASQTLTNKTLNSATLSLPVSTLADASTTFVNDADNSKAMRFDLSGISVSTTRVLTAPDADFTIVGTATAQTLSNKTIASPTVTGTLLLQNPSGAQPALALSEDPDNGTATVSIQAPADLSGGSYTLTLPGDDGTSGQVLSTDGSGVLSWAAAAVATATDGWIYESSNAFASLAFAANGNKLAGVNSGATAAEYKDIAVGTSGTDFAVAHSAGLITFNLPSASASNRGVVTTGTQTLAGAKTFSSGVAITGNTLTVGDGTTNWFATSALGSAGLTRISANAFSPIVNFSKARGASGSPAAVQSGDSVGELRFFGYSGAAAAYVEGARIAVTVGGTPDSGADTTDMPGAFALSLCPDGSASLRDVLTIANTGAFVVGAAATTPTHTAYGIWSIRTDSGSPSLDFNRSGTMSFELESTAADTLIFRNAAATNVGSISSGAWTLGGTGTSGSRIGHTINVAGADGASAYVTIDAKTALATNGTAVGFRVDDAGSFRAFFGNIKTAASANACGVIQWRNGGGSSANYLWTDSTGDLRYSATEADVGGTGGTAIGDQTSDIRLKENIEPSTYGLAEVLSLNPRTFNFIGTPDKREVGFIAQEVQALVPEAVYEGGRSISETERALVLQPYAMVPVLVKAIQELKAEFDAYVAAHP